MYSTPSLVKTGVQSWNQFRSKFIRHLDFFYNCRLVSSFPLILTFVDQMMTSLLRAADARNCPSGENDNDSIPLECFFERIRSWFFFNGVHTTIDLSLNPLNSDQNYEYNTFKFIKETYQTNVKLLFDFLKASIPPPLFTFKFGRHANFWQIKSFSILCMGSSQSIDHICRNQLDR